MITPTIIQPGVGAGPFCFGMTREQAWATTRSVVTSFFPQQDSTERTDDFRNHAIHCTYEFGKITYIVAFTSNLPYSKSRSLSLWNQNLGPETTYEDVMVLLELQNLSSAQQDEYVEVPDLGLMFGFKEGESEGQLMLEWVAVKMI